MLTTGTAMSAPMQRRRIDRLNDPHDRVDRRVFRGVDAGGEAEGGPSPLPFAMTTGN